MQKLIFLLALGALALVACQSGGDDAAEAPATPEPAAEEAAEESEAAQVAAVDADTSLPGDPVAGEPIYTRVCQACHGSDGRGNGGIGGDFVGQPERLAQDNAVLLATITDGSSANGRIMPPQAGILTEQEIKDVLSFIRQEFGAE